MFSFCMKVFVEKDNVDFGVGEVEMMSYGTVDVVFDGVVVVCLTIQWEFMFILGFAIPLLVLHMEVSFLTSLLGFLFLAPMFLWLLEINRRWSIKFKVLLLWIEGKMWCKL